MVLLVVAAADITADPFYWPTDLTHGCRRPARRKALPSLLGLPQGRTPPPRADKASEENLRRKFCKENMQARNRELASSRAMPPPVEIWRARDNRGLWTRDAFSPKTPGMELNQLRHFLAAARLR